MPPSQSETEADLAAAYRKVVKERDQHLAWVLRLIEAIDELKLWEPGRKGYAAAHRRLMAERDWAWREITEGRDVTDAEPYVGFPLYGR